MAFLDQHPGLGYPAAAALGLLLGSFLNVVILRLPKRMMWEWKREAREVLEQPDIHDPPPPGIVVEPSHCPHCKHKLSWYENIPLFSWIVQGGKCRHCKAPISIQYPLVEALTAVMVLGCVWQFGFGWQGFGAIVLTCFLIALSGIDLRTQYLPDQITLPLMWLGLVGSMDNLYMPAKPALIGAAAGFLVLWIVARAYKLVTNRDGMGGGDAKLLAALGAWCGLKGILPISLLSSVLGAVIGSIWLYTRGRDKATPIPFGPYLALAGWVYFMWGEPVVNQYLVMSGLR